MSEDELITRLPIDYHELVRRVLALETKVITLERALLAVSVVTQPPRWDTPYETRAAPEDL